MSLLRRRKSPEVRRDKVWVLTEPTPMRPHYYTTRFFFREMLDLPDQWGEGAEKIARPFRKITYVKDIRSHISYLAVEWISEGRDMDEATEMVVETGKDTLAKRFNWSEDVQVERLSSRQELLGLRRQEEVGGTHWVIGLG